MRLRTINLHKQILEQLIRGNYETALYGLRRFLMLLPPTHEGRADALTVTAFACLHTGRIADAVKVAQAALAIVPDHELARATLDDAMAASHRSAEE